MALLAGSSVCDRALQHLLPRLACLQIQFMKSWRGYRGPQESIQLFKNSFSRGAKTVVSAARWISPLYGTFHMLKKPFSNICADAMILEHDSLDCFPALERCRLS